MSYEFYKIIHLLGIVLLFSGLVGLLCVRMNNSELIKKVKILVFASHGLGVLFLIVSGFGLLARLELARDMPVWAYIKIGIWLLMVGAISLIKRKGHIGFPLFASLILIFFAATILAILKPI